MSSETKVCQNCKNSFRIEPDDFLFYEKIAVPPPTFCPDCRLQRRFASYNIFQLYKRACDLCGRVSVSRYSPDKKYRVYCPKCWWGDGWDASDYGRDYDFSRPFYEQFNELWRDVPVLGLSIDFRSLDDSQYTNNTGFLKQCYLIFEGALDERCFYGHFVVSSKDCVDSYFVDKCELSYDLFHGFKNYQCAASDYSTSCRDSTFLFQSENCHDCFASANLRNKQYYIFNEPRAKEEYFKEIEKFDLGSYVNYSRLKKEAREHRLKYPARVFWNDFSTNFSGLFVFESRNCRNCFEVRGAENSKYISYMEIPTVKESYDYTGWGQNAELVYEAYCAGENIRNLKFGVETGINTYNADYTTLTIGCSNIFACVSLRKKSYCVFNKQYSEEDFRRLQEKIIRQMDDMPYVDGAGRKYGYGEFFPVEISPFAYNETPAQIYYPLSESEAKKQGYNWKREEQSEHRVTIGAADLPDHIQNVADSVLRENIGCMKCQKAYKIVPQELSFYRSKNLPLPRLCFFCRLAERLEDQPHPLRLYKRTCQCTGKGSDNGVYENVAKHFHGQTHCANEPETGFAPERPEIIYCEQCYQSEVI